jgi:hypothetical protein
MPHIGRSSTSTPNRSGARHRTSGGAGGSYAAAIGAAIGAGAGVSA